MRFCDFSLDFEAFTDIDEIIFLNNYKGILKKKSHIADYMIVASGANASGKQGVQLWLVLQAKPKILAVLPVSPRLLLCTVYLFNVLFDPPVWGWLRLGRPEKP